MTDGQRLFEIYRRAWGRTGGGDSTRTAHWKCLTCGGMAPNPLTDDARCKCRDEYDRQWVRVDEQNKDGTESGQIVGDSAEPENSAVPSGVPTPAPAIQPTDDEIRAVWNRTQDPIATVRAFGSAIQPDQLDAQRYRWLRNRTGAWPSQPGAPVEFRVPLPRPTGNALKGSVAGHLDAAIDAAMRASSAGALPQPNPSQQEGNK
jgi:hypothetical protein